MAKSYAEKIIETKIMIDGLKEFKDYLPLGVKESTANDLETL